MTPRVDVWGLYIMGVSAEEMVSRAKRAAPSRYHAKGGGRKLRGCAQELRAGRQGPPLEYALGPTGDEDLRAIRLHYLAAFSGFCLSIACFAWRLVLRTYFPIRVLTLLIRYFIKKSAAFSLFSVLRYF